MCVLVCSHVCGGVFICPLHVPKLLSRKTEEDISVFLDHFCSYSLETESFAEPEGHHFEIIVE